MTSLIEKIQVAITKANGSSPAMHHSYYRHARAALQTVLRHMREEAMESDNGEWVREYVDSLAKRYNINLKETS